MKSEWDSRPNERDESVRDRLLSLVNSKGYKLYSSDGEPLSSVQLPVPRRQSGNADLQPELFGVELRINKSKLGQLLTRKYDAILKPKQQRKRGPSGLSEREKDYLDEWKAKHGSLSLYRTLDSLPSPSTPEPVEINGGADKTNYSTESARDSEFDACVDPTRVAPGSVESDLLKTSTAISAANGRNVDKSRNCDAVSFRTTQEESWFPSMRQFSSAEQQTLPTNVNIKLEEKAWPTDNMLEALSPLSAQLSGVGESIVQSRCDNRNHAFLCTIPQDKDTRFVTQNQGSVTVDITNYSNSDHETTSVELGHQDHALHDKEHGHTSLQQRSDRVLETPTEKSWHPSATLKGLLIVNDNPHQLQRTGTLDGVQDTNTTRTCISPKIETIDQQLSESDPDVDNLETDREPSASSKFEKTGVQPITISTAERSPPSANDVVKRRTRKGVPHRINPSSQPGLSSVGESGHSDDFDFPTTRGVSIFQWMSPILSGQKESTADFIVKQEKQSLPTSDDTRSVLSPQSSPSSDASESILQYRDGNTELFQDRGITEKQQDRTSSGKQGSLIASSVLPGSCLGTYYQNRKIQNPEVIVISSDEDDYGPNSKVPRLETTTSQSNSAISRTPPENRDTSDVESCSANTDTQDDDNGISDPLQELISQNLSRTKVSPAKRRLAIQEGHDAHKRFAERLEVPPFNVSVSVGPKWVYVSADCNVCLSGQVDILQDNYLFEVKNSLANRKKKRKLGQSDIRECQFYMMLCQVDYAFFVVEHSKEIFVVPYDPRVFKQTKRCAEELANFYLSKP